jgi:hypothetical protein
MLLTASAAPVKVELSDAKAAISNTTALATQVETALGSLSKIKSDEISGWGAQVGIMLKGFVESVGDGVKMTTDEICRVADTKVGKICTFVIVYKIIGKDLIDTGRSLVRSLCGIVLLIVFVSVVCKFYKWFFNPTSVVDRTETIDGKTITYYKGKPSIREDVDAQEDGLSWLVLFIASGIILGVGALICAMI